jgi:hypothetical protein
MIEKYIVNNCGEHFQRQHDNMEFNGGKWEEHLRNQLDSIKIEFEELGGTLEKSAG